MSKRNNKIKSYNRISQRKKEKEKGKCKRKEIKNKE